MDSKMHISLEKIVSCPNCASNATVVSAHSIIGGRQRFSETIVCPACRHCVEGDGDRPDPATRELLIEATGEWRLQLESLGPQRARAIRAISDCATKSLVEASAIAKSLPATIVEGTRIEVEIAALLLERFGAQVSRTRIR